jgi:hypothetical protein
MPNHGQVYMTKVKIGLCATEATVFYLVLPNSTAPAHRPGSQGAG